MPSTIQLHCTVHRDILNAWFSMNLFTRNTDGEKTMTSKVVTVEVPFEALVKELGAKRTTRFIGENRKSYGGNARVAHFNLLKHSLFKRKFSRLGGVESFGEGSSFLFVRFESFPSNN